ncbi:MAG: YihY/virulence factor BrkB family protein [Arcicella sp.]|nr:YihY/virulence factor BrkB family protein [Arcicella sp.]
MQLNLKNIGKLFKSAYKAWNEKDPFRQSAVIAYYAIFSIPGLLVLIIAITGYFFGKDAVNQNIIAQISSTMGPDTAASIKDILIKSSHSNSSVLGSIIGIGVLLMGATGVFVELQKSLNDIWHVKLVKKSGILPILKARLFSFGLILAIAFLLLISLVVSTGLSALSDLIKTYTSNFTVIIFEILNFIFSLVVISILFAMMFKILPDAKIEWKHVWMGSLLTGLLFTIGKTALAFYFGKANPGSNYGAAGSVILMLLWVSYSSMIVFFGAEFTAAYARRFSGRVAPSEIAKAVPPQEIKQNV